MTVRWGIKEGLFREVRSKPTDEHEMRAHASPRAREGHDQDRELSAQMQGGRKEREGKREEAPLLVGLE